MSSLKSLASQTAIYGVPSILGRVLNYALVMLHTSAFASEGMGNVSYLYAAVAFLLVTYTFGMETTLFRFATRDKSNNYYNLAGTVVLVISLFFTALILLNNSTIAGFIGISDYAYLINWIAIILFIDAITALPFAKLRLENKAGIFAIAKMANIITNIGLQIMFLIVLPAISKGEYFQFLQPFTSANFSNSLGIGYIFLANLLASVLLIPLLWKSISQFRLAWDWKLMKPMFLYATPIFITGIAGLASERIDNFMLVHLLPDGFYSSMNSKEALGVYAQTMKLSIFMLLAIQAFRYAGEPFFFSNADKKDSPELFAKVLHYFVLLSLIIFVGVSVNVDLVAQIFLRREEYRQALYLVPILLFAKLIWGVYINLSVWFKLTDKTIYGTYFSILGAVITILGNIVLIPIIGFAGSAITMVLSYLTITILCYLFGQKHYAIPYNFKPLIAHVVVAGIIVYLAHLLQFENKIIHYTVGLVLFVVYTFGIWLLERNKLETNKSG